MAETNFRVFNEEMNPDRTFSDAEYDVATQRHGGVIPGMALSRLHNKLYRQSTAMAKAIADLLVAQGIDCMDNDVPTITTGIETAILNITSGQVGSEIESHNINPNAHGLLTITMASASTMNIGAAEGNFITVTGTNTISVFDVAPAGTKRSLRFADTLTIVYNATSLILPGVANIAVSAGDIMEFVSLGEGNWVCTDYQPASGLQRTSCMPNANATVYHLRDVVAHYANAGTVGTFCLTLPISWTRSSLRINIVGKSLNGKTWTATLKGVNGGGVSGVIDPIWTYTYAELSPNCPFTSVRFGHDGTHCCILLGTTSSAWDSTSIIVSDVFVPGITAMNAGLFKSWSTSVITNETGITVSSTPTTTILAAIVAESLSTNGYCKLSNGLLLQWGFIATSGASQPTTVIFPIAFPSAPLNITLSYVNSVGTTTPVVGMVGTSTATSMQIFTNQTSGTAGFNWFAIGK